MMTQRRVNTGSSADRASATTMAPRQPKQTKMGQPDDENLKIRGLFNTDMSKMCTISLRKEGVKVPELTMLLLYQVVLLHPVGSELIGRYSGKSRAIQQPSSEQQHQRSYTNVS